MDEKQNQSDIFPETTSSDTKDTVDASSLEATPDVGHIPPLIKDVNRDPPQRKRGRAPTIPMPSIRVLFHKRPGLALDAYLPFSRHFHCYMSAESYFNDSSVVKFGLEPIALPFLRLQLAPQFELSLRVPMLRFGHGRMRQIEIGGSFLPMYGQGNRYIPSVEFRQRNTFLDLIVGEQGRKHLGKLLKDRENELRRIVENKGALKDVAAGALEKLKDGVGDGFRVKRPSPDKPFGGLDPRKRRIQTIPDKW